MEIKPESLCSLAGKYIIDMCIKFYILLYYRPSTLW